MKNAWTNKRNFILLGLIVSVLFFQSCTVGHGKYKWVKESGNQVLYYGADRIGLLKSANEADLKISDQISEVSDGLFRVVRTVRNAGSEEIKDLRLTLDFVHVSPPSWVMIPSVSYNGNEWGRGLEPKGFQKDGTWWSFSYTRTPIPGVTYSEGAQWAIAWWGELDEQNRPFSCSLMPEEAEVTHSLIWPEEEMPLSYSNRDEYVPGFKRDLALNPGETITLTAMLSVTQVLPDHTAIQTFLDQAWNQIPHPEIPVREPAEIWDLAVRFIKESLWAEEDIFKGFSIGLWLRDGGWIQRPGWKYEIGWAGQNASMANSLLENYLRSGDQESLQMGLACLDSWANHASLPNGLIRTHFDYIIGIEKGEEVLDACNLGDAAYDLLTAWELAGKCGMERDNYKTVALGICDFMLNDQQPSGQYGKGWSKDGTCLYRDGTIGAFVIPAMLSAYRVTGDNAYLASAKRAYDFYYEDFTSNGYTSAGALDTWCIDKESSLPMLRSALMLYDLTSDKTYLDKAEKSSWYITTWMWHYSVPFADSTDFVRYGYDTFGGTSVSTQHHHLDAFALMMAADWLKLSELTGNPVWKERALAAWANGNQCVADGKTEYHNVIRPAGSQTEAYYQTYWCGTPGYFADWLVCWMSAFRLEVLRATEDWNALK